MGFIIWVALGIAGLIVASNKGRNGCGWLIVVLLLGPVGLILVWVMAKDEKAIEQQAVERGGMKKCPACAELVKREALLYKHCGTAFDPGKIIR